MLKEGSFTGRKFRLVYLGALLGWVVSLLGGMADSIIAGMFLDSEAVSAVGLITPIESVFYFFSLVIGLGSAILYSRTLGAFQAERSKKIAGMGLFLAIVLGAVSAVILFFCRGAILHFYGVTDSLYQYASAYYTPIILVLGIYPIFWTLYYLVSYDGDEKLILLADVLTAVSNTFFSLLLVRKMGIAGLGYGTFLSNVIALACIMPHFRKKSNSISFKMYFSFDTLAQMIKLSSAIALITLYMGIIDIAFNKIVIVLFSVEYLPAYAVINVIMNFACALNCAISAGSMFVSVAYGENNPFSLKRVMNLTNKYAVFSSIGLTAILEVLAPVWPDLYAIEDPRIYDMALYAGRIIPVFFLAAAFVYTYLVYYPIIEKTIEGNILVLCYMLIGPLAVAAPLAWIGGFNAMSLGFGITPIFALLVLYTYLLITGQSKKLPYLLDESDEKETHFDLELKTDNVLNVRDRIARFLQENGVSETIVSKVELMVEDELLYIMKKNTRKVICEVTVLVNDEHVRLISKDNGIIFDITEEADDAVDFSAYVLANIMQNAHEASNSTTISFNRNMCIWER